MRPSSVLGKLPLLCLAVASNCGGEKALRAGDDAGTAPSDTKNEAGAAVDDGLPGTPTTLAIGTNSATFVDLSELGVVETERSALDWDLVFEGWRVFTNGGVSGPGRGAVFGPSDPLDLLFDTVPSVPLLQDKARGGLTDWFIYMGGTVSSRMHIFGIQDGAKYWKLQVLSYYGQDTTTGMEASALIELRYARMDDDGASEVIVVEGLDATSGGYGAVDDTTAGCLDLRTGESLLLDKEARQGSEEWHVCFQRTDAFVNGGLSGPGRVLAADLDRLSQIPLETEADADAELARFEAVTLDELTDADVVYGADDGISSIFEDNWVDAAGPNAEPLDASWIVRGADGLEHFALLFTGLQGATNESPGTVSLRVKQLTISE